VKHGPRVISNAGPRWAAPCSSAELTGTSGVIATGELPKGCEAMAAEEKRDARMAGLMLGCIVMACFALSALGMNY
jgi:hypothetical protein